MDAAAKQLAKQSEKFHAFEWLRGLAIAGNKHAQIILEEDEGVMADMKKIGRDEILFGPDSKLRGCFPLVLYFKTAPEAEEFSARLRGGNPNLETRRLR